MMDIEDYLQDKNRNVTDMNAPLLADYPTGYVDTIKLPLCLSWVTQTIIDSSGTLGNNKCQIDVTIQTLAQGDTIAVKQRCKVIRDLFMVEYKMNTQNMWISLDPPVRVIPGTIEIGGIRNVIEGFDGSLFHGFIIKLRTEVHITDADGETEGCP